MNNSPKVLYVLIGIFCIFAIIAGVYDQFIAKKPNNTTENNSHIEEPSYTEKSAETIKSEFNQLFTNTINLDNYDTTGILKLVEDQEIVYTFYDMVENKDAYEVNMKIPLVNIRNEVANSFNSITQAVFANKATEIMSKTDTENKTIYSIDYVGYINGDILSLIIRSTLKEGDNAQRIMIQTYNYNLSTEKQVELTELLNIKQLNKDDVDNKIKKVVKEADDESKAVQSMGYNEIYSRDLESQIYTVENGSTYFLGPNQELYIIYAYGNNNFTSEMDIVLFE